MRKLNLPEYEFKIIKKQDGKMYILDTVRKKYIQLTPEEWVRQHIIQFLTQEKKYPESLISVETQLPDSRLALRYDVVVYNRKGEPVMLIECKAPDVSIQQNTFDQVNAYNRSVQVPYILITNGIKHYCCKHVPEEKEYVFLDQIPEYNSL